MPVGSLTFFTGPMACGKTLELVRQLQIYAEQHIPTVCIRPATDTRSEDVRSRSGMSWSGLTIKSDDLEALKQLLYKHDVVGVDEAQFFAQDIVPLLHNAVRDGKTVLIAGLDTDFRGDIFPTALALLSLPETIVLRTRAVCAVCRNHNATRTQRLKNGQPVSRDEPTVAVEGAGDAVTYEARCLDITWCSDRVRKRIMKISKFDIPPGTGKVFKGAGQHGIAVYRKSDGLCVALSADCPHKHCDVVWNDKDKTWDCPCHSSRFKPDGSLIQGPAIDPLKKLAAQDLGDAIEVRE